MFRTVPLSIITSFLLYTQQWYICHTGLLAASCQQTCMTYTIAVCTVKTRDDGEFADIKLSANLYDIYYCCVYSKNS